MKGTIDLHEKWGWGVINHTDESIPDWIPLHPDDLTHFAEMKEKFDNFEARVLSSPEVEFETIIHPKFTGRIIYAKLNTKEEPKQETLEEAGVIAAGLCQHLEAKEQAMFIAGFIECAKWQQEQDKNKYNEEEVLEIVSNCDGSISQAKKWFEQFKKK
jgi:hypothetical protein